MVCQAQIPTSQNKQGTLYYWPLHCSLNTHGVMPELHHPQNQAYGLTKRGIVLMHERDEILLSSEASTVLSC